MSIILNDGQSSHPQFLIPLTEPRQLWIVGLARSGTNWLMRLLADAIGAYDYDTDKMTKPGVVGRLHWILERPPGGKVLFIYRDPRDTIVSMMHLWQFDSIQQVLYPEDQPPLLPTISDYFQKWLMELEPEATTRYEWLLADTRKELLRLLGVLMIEYDPERIDRVIERQTFASRKAAFQNSGMKDHVRTLRGGISGQWRSYLSLEEGYKIDYWLGDWMFRMGYEMSPNWWEELPE